MAHHGLETTIIGAAAGAVTGFIATLVTTRWRLWWLQYHLHFEAEPGSIFHSHKSARIYNGYIFPLRSVFAYITIVHQLSDIVSPPPGMNAFVNKTCPKIVTEDRLCWSFAGNPASIDIYSKERQAIGIANVTADWIEFPSEDGWATMTNGKETSRVFLARKKYHATIKIVSKDTKAKEFKIVIDPNNVDSPITVLRTSRLELFRQWRRQSH
jgi:hypothetical protein